MYANGVGSEKFSLPFVGNTKHPFHFNNIKSLPCTYHHIKVAWIDIQDIYEFLACFSIRMTWLKKTIFLYVDQCHTPMGFREFARCPSWVSFSANTLVLLPVDQGIIRAVNNFPRSLVLRLLKRLTPNEHIFILSLYDPVRMLFIVWSWYILFNAISVRHWVLKFCKHCLNTFWKDLMMVHCCQDYLVVGLCQMCRIEEGRVFQKLDVYILTWKGREVLTVLSPSYWNNVCCSEH